jgi:phosphoglycolate phosphatase-like HAD superfamily hydrolase
MTSAIISHTIKAVAIDLDGTLLDTINDLAAGANGMRSRLGMALLPLDRIKSYVGDGMVSLVKRTLDRFAPRRAGCRSACGRGWRCSRPVTQTC